MKKILLLILSLLLIIFALLYSFDTNRLQLNYGSARSAGGTKSNYSIIGDYTPGLTQDDAGTGTNFNNNIRIFSN